MIETKNVNKNKKSRRRRRRRAKLNYRRVFGVALVLTVIVACLILISRCGGTGLDEAVTAEQRVVERGYADAMKAAQAPEGSMEREKCILSIRAFESKLRQNGYAREADDYHDAAERVLKGQGIIK